MNEWAELFKMLADFGVPTVGAGILTVLLVVQQRTHNRAMKEVNDQHRAEMAAQRERFASLVETLAMGALGKIPVVGEVRLEPAEPTEENTEK